MTTPSHQPFRPRVVTRRGSRRSPLSVLLQNKVSLVIGAFVLGYVVVVMRWLRPDGGPNPPAANMPHQQTLREKAEANRISNVVDDKAPAPPKSNSDKSTTATSTCDFRHYPPRRYYGLPNTEQPDFLANVEYIHGEYPMILPTTSGMEKLCVNQAAWLTDQDEGRLPFADGTNPSILHISRLQETDHHDEFKALGVAYIATICMTNSQCQWQDSPEEVEEYKLSTRDNPNTVRTQLMLLDQHFSVLRESTIMMERNAVWGNRKLKPQPDGKGGFSTTLRPLDDARLFMYDKKLWVSYRDGKAFGYDKQVLNPLHMSLDGTSVTIKASETVTFCCGRNMALMTTEGSEQLQSLTWVDPVTVIDVHTVAEGKEEQRRRLMRDNKKKSHVHGTNAFMVPYNKNTELLGMAHFHRPHDRNANEYARFGHHYTHAFFTISAEAPFRLKRLSPEFLLPSKHHEKDAEIIQFISGLEVIEGEDKVVLAWGINDCEGAAGSIDFTKVESLLRDVPEGKEVVDFMIKPSASS